MLYTLYIVSDRISYMRTDCKPRCMSLINVYPLTETAEERIRQTFYNTLEEMCDKIPKQDMSVGLGDFNAQIERQM